MMSVLEYAEDVNRTVKYILDKCKEAGIEAFSEEDLLDEDAIVILDNSLDDEEDTVLEEETALEEALESKAEKVKPSKKVNKTSKPTDRKKDLAKKKKDMYKVSLTNKANNHEQIILKNNDGVYVLTPSLNKSFKFQWWLLIVLFLLRMLKF